MADRRSLGALALAAIAAVGFVAAAPAAGAQSMAVQVPPREAPRARDAAVLLQVRPHLGDTIRMHLDQTAEMSGTTRIGAADSTMTVTTSMHVRTHAVVQKSDAGGTTLLSITDSVALGVTGSRAADPAAMAAAARRLEGRQSLLRLAPDGAAEALGGDRDLPPALGALLAAMPASLPRTPVAPGASWTREMAIPGAEGTGAGRGSGTLKATFHLDSLSRSGDLAFISVRGSISRDGDAADMPPGVTLSMRGTVNGELRVDRRRGWVTASRTDFTINSVMSPPAGSTDAPMRVRMRLVQRLRCDEPARGAGGP